MTVNLTPELASFVKSQVRAGWFASADDLLTAAVLRPQDEESADEVDDGDRAAIAEAEAEVAAGLDRPWDEVELRRKYLGG